MQVKALPNRVLVVDLERGMRQIGSIIVPDDNGKSEGIRPRWAKVFSVGDNIDDILPGQWILIEHGRWTRSLKVKDENNNDFFVWGVEYPDSVLLVTDDEPSTEIYSKWV